jgi:hypothetical protein
LYFSFLSSNDLNKLILGGNDLEITYLFTLISSFPDITLSSEINASGKEKKEVRMRIVIIEAGN